MLRIGICDDNREDIARIRELAVRFSEEHPETPVQIQAYGQPYDLLDEVEKAGGFDLYLLDVVMPHMTGVALACVIAKPFQNRLVGVAVGTAVVCFIRFMCSFLSGVLIWGNLSDGLPAWTYSLTYNGSYMLPETILTTVAAVLIYKAAPQLFAAQEQ